MLAYRSFLVYNVILLCSGVSGIPCNIKSPCRYSDNLTYQSVFPVFRPQWIMLAKLVSRRLPPVLTDGDGRNDECVSVKQSGGLGWKVPAEVLQEKVFFRLLLAVASGSHGCGLTGLSASKLRAQGNWHVGVRGEEGRVSTNAEIRRVSLLRCLDHQTDVSAYCCPPQEDTETAALTLTRSFASLKGQFHIWIQTNAMDLKRADQDVIKCRFRM